MIAIKPFIKDIKEYQRGNLPANAVKLNTPSSLKEMTKKAAPIAAVFVTLLFVAMLIKTFSSGISVVSFPAVIIGFLAGFILLAVHEWLHAIVYPKDAKVTIGKVKGKLLFVALASYPLARTRFIMMCLLPFVLGIIPLAVFVFSPAEHQTVNGFMFGMACIGMVSPHFDVYNVIVVLKQSRKTDRIMFYEDKMYRIPQ